MKKVELAHFKKVSKTLSHQFLGFRRAKFFLLANTNSLALIIKLLYHNTAIKWMLPRS